MEKEHTRKKTTKASSGCKPAGAFSRLTPEVITDILDKISEGSSVNAAIAAHSVSSYVWYERMRDDEELTNRYARARECCAHAHASGIIDLVQDVRTGMIPPDVARVELEARKWTASKLHFAQYGDKQAVETKVVAKISEDPMSAEEWEAQYGNR